MASARNLGSLTIDLIARIGGWTDGLSKAERELNSRTKRMNKMAYDFGQSFGSSIKSAAGSFLAFAGVAVSLTAIGSSFKNAIDRADQLRDASIRLGIGVETLSAYSYAAQQTGTDLEELNKGLLRLSKNATAALNPASKQAGLFEALGVSKDSLTDLDRLVPQVAEAFSKLEDGALKASLAQELFGKSGANLIEFLNQGDDGIKSLTDRARELGVVIDQDTADKADAFNDQLADLKAVAGGLATQFASELLPRLTDLVERLANFAKEGTNAAEGAHILGTALDAVVSVAGAVETRVEGLGKALSGLGEYFTYVYGAAKDFLSLDFSRMETLRKLAGGAVSTIAGGLAQSTTGIRPATTPSPKLPQGIDFTRGAPVSPQETSEIEKRLRLRFAGADQVRSSRSSGGRSGKSDDEKEADRLQQAYERIRDDLVHQKDLIGATTEAAKTYFEVTQGGLKDLEPAKKQELLALSEGVDLSKARNDEINIEVDARKQQKEAIKSLLEDLQHEFELLGKTSDQQEVLNNLRYAGIKVSDEGAAAVARQTEELQKQREATQYQIDGMDALRDSARGFLDDLKEGKGVWDSLKNALDNFADALFDLAAKRLVEQIFGKTGETAGDASGGGWISALFSTLFGKGQATGGQVTAGKLYPVNELGPEMFSANGQDYLMMGSQNGRITPNHLLSPKNISYSDQGMAGEGSQVNQYNQFTFAAPTSTKTQAQLSARTGFEIRRAQRLRT